MNIRHPELKTLVMSIWKFSPRKLILAHWDKRILFFFKLPRMRAKLCLQFAISVLYYNHSSKTASGNYFILTKLRMKILSTLWFAFPGHFWRWTGGRAVAQGQYVHNPKRCQAQAPQPAPPLPPEASPPLWANTRELSCSSYSVQLCLNWHMRANHSLFPN